MSNTTTIIENKTSASTIVRREAMLSNLGIDGNRFLIPIFRDGHGAGHTTAHFHIMHNDRIGFYPINETDVAWYDSLDGIYLI